MTEIANRDEGALEHQPELAPVAATKLVQWAYEARQAAVIAESLARTSFVPVAFRGKPAEVTAAILAGQEIGLDPMASLRAIDIIQGKPALSALAQRAVVQSRGHDVWVAESTATRAVVRGRRHGTGEEQVSVWSMDRANKMGLLGKDNWKLQPQAMLVARASAECCRLVAADALLGMPYAVEELDDGNGSDVAPVPAAPAKKTRTAKRAPLVQAPMPELDPTPEPETQVADDADADEPDPEPDWPDVTQPPKDGAA
jgi:hypothetical protein